MTCAGRKAYRSVGVTPSATRSEPGDCDTQGRRRSIVPRRALLADTDCGAEATPAARPRTSGDEEHLPPARTRTELDDRGVAIYATGPAAARTKSAFGADLQH